jgi:UTP--glucose-1-phosphate uridylyltransferase
MIVIVLQKERLHLIDVAKQKVRKAIIPAAGLGTRFLPATKAQPKEMLPIVDKPSIQYIVEEAIASGIEDILIISGRGKRAIEDHFDKTYELEKVLQQKNKLDLLAEVQAISELANIHYIRQKEPLGLGHAIWCARSFVGNEPFAVMLGDDIIHSEIPCLKQMIEVYNQQQCAIIGVQQVPDEDVSKYGIIAPNPQHLHQQVMEVLQLVEKPRKGQAPSNFAIMGRYILTPEIFSILDHQAPGSGGEIQLTDAISRLNEQQQVMAYCFQGQRYDIGDKLGFIVATLDFALRRPELKQEVLRYIANVLHQHNNS